MTSQWINKNTFLAAYLQRDKLRAAVKDPEEQIICSEKSLIGHWKFSKVKVESAENLMFRSEK